MHALRDASIHVAYGEVFAHLGRNGFRNATTIRIHTGLTAVTSGQARVAGVDVARAPTGVRRVRCLRGTLSRLDGVQVGQIRGYRCATDLVRHVACAVGS